MTYRHVQRGSVHLLLLVLGITALALAYVHPNLAIFTVPVGIAFLVLALCFGTLTVETQEDALAVHFGPLPLFRRRIPYDRIRRAEPGRSTFIDGVGIHWVPGRGWIWNLGFGPCVELQLDNGPFRIGTDDPQSLVEALRPRLED